jgi:hypothetical protein
MGNSKKGQGSAETGDPFAAFSEWTTEADENAYEHLRLTDEQLAEVRRRRADPNPKRLTLDEARRRLNRITARQGKDDA